MKTLFNNSLIWGLLSLVVGLLIAFNPVSAIQFSIVLIGILLLVVGGVQLLSFAASRRRLGLSWSAIPLGGILGVVLGLMLVISPEMFAAFFMILVGVAVALMAVLQIYSLVKLSNTGTKLKWTIYIFPVLMLLSSIVIFMFPLGTTAWVVVFAGLWIAAFGLSEIAARFIIKLPQSDSSANESN